MWCCLDIVESPSVTPVGDSGDIDVEQRRGGFGAVTPIAALASVANPRCLGTGAGDVIGRADPVDFAGGERAASARSQGFAIELLGDVDISMFRG
jgi:hypothetical protein